jgi:hypothetical protein
MKQILGEVDVIQHLSMEWYRPLGLGLFLRRSADEWSPRWSRHMIHTYIELHGRRSDGDY